MKYFILLITCFLSFMAHSRTFQVGSNYSFKTPAELSNTRVLSDGDTIYISAEDFIGNDALANWLPNKLVIIGQGNKPKLKAAGKYILGKGIWVLSGDSIEVHNISFEDAKVPSKNGAGIRLDGHGMFVYHCTFRNNEDGILVTNTNKGGVHVYYSEFDGNGYGDGLSHSIYVGYVEHCVFYGNYSHHAKIGHCFKSRAAKNDILYNRFADEETGNSSRLIDVPNGGDVLIMGNELMQGPRATNNNVIGYGLEGLKGGYKHKVNIVNNTMVNKRQASCIFVKFAPGTYTSKVINNIMVGKGVSISGTVTESHHNFINSSIDSAFLKDEANKDYSLTGSGFVIHGGTTLIEELTPSKEYTRLSVKERLLNATIDIGAHEWPEPFSVSEMENYGITLYPNPVKTNLYIVSPKQNITSINLINILGEAVLEFPFTPILNVSNLERGVYLVQMKLNSGTLLNSKLLVQ